MKTYFDEYLDSRMKDPEFAKAYNNINSKQVVFLVGWDDVDMYSVEYICASQDTAKKRFEQIRLMLLHSAKDRYQKAKNTGMLGYDILWDRHIKTLETITFENPNVSCSGETPFWSMHILEE